MKGLTIMLRVLTALLVFAAVAPNVAEARRAVEVRSTVRAHNIGQPGAIGVLAGELRDPALGAGAVIYRVRYPALTFTFKAWTDRGWLRGSGRIRATPRADGLLALAGRAVVSGGGGLYRDARGQLRIQGTTDGVAADELFMTGRFTTASLRRSAPRT